MSERKNAKLSVFNMAGARQYLLNLCLGCLLAWDMLSWVPEGLRENFCEISQSAVGWSFALCCGSVPPCFKTWPCLQFDETMPCWALVNHTIWLNAEKARLLGLLQSMADRFLEQMKKIKTPDLIHTAQQSSATKRTHRPVPAEKEIPNVPSAKKLLRPSAYTRNRRKPAHKV